MADTSNLQSDNPYFSTQPIVDGASTATPDDVTGMALSMLLVQPTSPAQLEQIRTFLSTHTDALDATDPPKTFGEQVQLRLNVSDITQRLFLIAVLITIVVAGCSLAVAVGGGLVERKRPFGLLRLTGAGTGTLYRVVLLESVLPLITATIVAAGTAYGLAVLTVEKMAPVGSPLPDPGLSYYATTAGGLLAALAIIVAVLPVLGRITGPENARFE
jgi:ABC-type antimicrobial peptide transport system permease subunit